VSENLLVQLWKDYPAGFVIVGHDGKDLTLYAKGTKQNELLYEIQLQAEAIVNSYIQNPPDEDIPKSL
jgi:hypothetical protein